MSGNIVYPHEVDLGPEFWFAVAAMDQLDYWRNPLQAYNYCLKKQTDLGWVSARDLLGYFPLSYDHDLQAHFMAPAK